MDKQLMQSANPVSMYGDVAKWVTYGSLGIAAAIGVVLLARTFRPGSKAKGEARADVLEAKAEKKQERAEAIDSRTRRKNERACRKSADARAEQDSKGTRPRRARLAKKAALSQRYYNECISRFNA